MPGVPLRPELSLSMVPRTWKCIQPSAAGQGPESFGGACLTIGKMGAMICPGPQELSVRNRRKSLAGVRGLGVQSYPHQCRELSTCHVALLTN